MTVDQAKHQILVDQTAKQELEGRKLSNIALSILGISRVEVIRTVEARKAHRNRALDGLRNR